jgi:hypothetical protein
MGKQHTKKEQQQVLSSQYTYLELLQVLWRELCC